MSYLLLIVCFVLLTALVTQFARRPAGLVVSPKPAAPPSPLPMIQAREWRASDQVAWLGYLQTPSGAALLERMRAVAAVNARAGAADSMSPAHSSGRATGFYDAIDWLTSQALIEREAETLSGADADQSATSTHEALGEAALRDSMSP